MATKRNRLGRAERTLLVGWRAQVRESLPAMLQQLKAHTKLAAEVLEGPDPSDALDVLEDALDMLHEGLSEVRP